MRTPLLVLAALAVAAPAARAQDFLGRARPDWLKELSHENASLRRSAAFALGKIGDASDATLTALARALRDDHPPVRDAAAFALGEIAAAGNGDRVWSQAGQVLLEKLQDRDPRVRRSAAFALGSCGPAARTALAALGQALRDENASVRRNAAWALGRIGRATDRREAVERLIAALSRADEEPLVLRDIAGALGEIGRPEAGEAARPLARVYRDSIDKAVRRTALNTLVNLVGPELAKAPPGANAVLVQALHSVLRTGDAETKEDAESKKLVAAALANLGEHAAPAVKDLAALLADDSASSEARRNAAVALASAPEAIRNLPREESRDVVLKLGRALEPGQPAEVRQYSAEALARIGFPVIEPALNPLLRALQKDPDNEVRHKAAWAFLNANIEQLPGALEALKEALKDPYRVVAYDAARSLARSLGARAPDEVIDVLERMLTDRGLKIFSKSTTDVSGGGEAKGGRSDVRPDISGDARYMAAMALSWIGRRAGRASIIQALEDLARTGDQKNREEAEKALQVLRP